MSIQKHISYTAKDKTIAVGGYYLCNEVNYKIKLLFMMADKMYLAFEYGMFGRDPMDGRMQADQFIDLLGDCISEPDRLPYYSPCNCSGEHFIEPNKE